MPDITTYKRIPITQETWGITTTGTPLRRMTPTIIPMNISPKMGMTIYIIKPDMFIKMR